VRRISAVIAVVMAIGVFVTSAGAAAAVVAPRTFSLSTSQAATVTVVLPRHTYSSVCLSFTFGSNALDPNEEIDFSIAGRPVGGFFNPGPSAETSRTYCFTDPSVVQEFGSHPVRLTMTMPTSAPGSVEVTGLAVSAT
jgi:hypothetical protein